MSAQGIELRLDRFGNLNIETNHLHTNHLHARIFLHHMMPWCQVVLIGTSTFATVRPMAKGKDRDEAGVWNFREVPRDIIVKAKIEAAIQGKSVKALLMDLVETHWQELEKKGLLPKGK